MEISPRRRTVAFALVLLANSMFASGCGSSSLPLTSPQPPPVPAGSVVGTVSENHTMPHMAILTAAQLSAGTGLTMDISNGLHSHVVILTDTDMRQITARARVSVASSTNPHSNGSDPHRHTVTFN